MKIGFIGLGTMGSGMAANIARSEHDLLVYDLNQGAVDRLVEAGAVAAKDVGQVAAECEVVFTSLPGPVQVEQVVLGPGGLLPCVGDGMVLFDLSTSSLGLARRIHDEFAQRGATMFDAPVSGGPAGAASGDLALWVGGDPAVFDAHVDVLRTFSSHPHHVGEVGAGTITKLAHNMLGYMFLESMAEVFSLAVKAGLDPLDLWEGIRLGLVGRGSPMDMLVKQFLPGVYEPPAFALNLAYKDVSLTTELGRELGVPMRLANMTMAEMAEAIGKGMGSQDSRAFMQLQLERAGVSIEVDQDRLADAIKRAAGD